MAQKTTVYNQICAIAEKHKPAGYLANYAADLHKHDQNTLAEAVAEAKPDSRYIWILRDCGTALFPVAVGHDPVWATYWLKQGNSRAAPSLAYLIDVAKDSVVPVTYERAETLAKLPHPQGAKIKVSLLGSNPAGAPAPY